MVCEYPTSQTKARSRVFDVHIAYQLMIVVCGNRIRYFPFGLELAERALTFVPRGSAPSSLSGALDVWFHGRTTVPRQNLIYWHWSTGVYEIKKKLFASMPLTVVAY